MLKQQLYHYRWTDDTWVCHNSDCYLVLSRKSRGRSWKEKVEEREDNVDGEEVQEEGCKGGREGRDEDGEVEEEHIEWCE